MRGTASHDRLVLAGAALSFCAHLAWLPRHLEDIDSFNFALGLRDYDIAAHQPHPPGYPVFTVLARGVLALVSPWVSDAATQAAVALAILAGGAGALAVIALHAVLRLVDNDTPYAVDRESPAVHERAPAMPVLVAALTAVTPLFWLTASRPLSDMPGLAGALGCQWLLLRAARAGASVRDALVAAVACGAGVGLRSQVTWLVVPLLVWVLWQVWRRTGIRTAFGVGAAALAGVLAWAVPMVAITGGATAYRVALASQAGEDFEGVPMLVLQPGLRRHAAALVDTFVWPWGWWPVAAVMLGLALIGLVGLRGRRRLTTWLALGFGPYLVYHVLLQETETTRYALPLVPPVATLIVLACRTWAGRLAVPLATAACIAALAVSVQAHRQYLGTGATISEVLAAMDAQARAARHRRAPVAATRRLALTRRRGARWHAPADRSRGRRHVAGR